MQTNTGQPCGICGDVGYAKDIATCSKCRKSREHIYCMNPNLFNVPRSWHCEACQRDNLVLRNACNSDGSRRYSEVEVQDSSKRQKTWASENASSKVHEASNGIYSPRSKSELHFLSKNVVAKKVETGKVKYIPAEDVCGPSGAKPKLKSLHGGSNSQLRSLGTNRRSIPKRTSAAPKSFPEKVRAYKSVSHPNPPAIGKVHSSTLQKPSAELYQPLCGLKSQSSYPCKSSTSEDFRNMEHLSIRDNRHTTEAHHSAFSYTRPEVSSVQERREFGKASSGPDKHEGEADSLPAKDYVCKEKFVVVPLKFGEEDLPNPPAIDASWKGCFEVLNFSRERCDGIQAYPPGKVLPKAFLVSKQLPRVLKFTLLPRHDVWPEIFHTKPPCGFDIALYFWVDDFCRSRENYNRLLELMDKQDLSMRSHLGDVELFIFTSRQLPIDSQRMNMQFYLWGVFHSLKAQQSSFDLKGKQQAVEFPLHNFTVNEDSVSALQKADGQRVDKNIGIVACEGVRVVDKWMRSNPHATFWDDSQDAFSRIHSNQHVEKITASRLVHDGLKIEQCDEVDSPPGLFSESDDAPPGFSRSEDVPPGFTRPFNDNAFDDSRIGPPHPKMSHVAKEVDARGSSEWTKLREKFSSYKVTCVGTESNEHIGRSLHTPNKRCYDGRMQTQSGDTSWDSFIQPKKSHCDKRDGDLSWDSFIQPKKEQYDTTGWGTSSVTNENKSKSDGWGKEQSREENAPPNKERRRGNKDSRSNGRHTRPNKQHYDGWHKNR